MALAAVCLAAVAWTAFWDLRSIHHRISHSRWPTGAFRSNSLIGFEMTPGFEGQMKGGTFYVKAHRLGFRLVLSAPSDSVVPGGILTTGCSFVYGDEVNAEDTFSAKLANALKRPVYNYGVSSYSLASILLQLWQLEKLRTLAELRPSTLIVSVGQWLEARSIDPFYPTDTMPLTYAHFAASQGRIEIAPPLPFLGPEHGFELAKTLFAADGRGESGQVGKALPWLGVLPRLWLGRAVRGARRLWGSPISQEALYAHFIGELAAFSMRHSVRPVVLWIPTLPQAEIPPGLTRAIANHSEVVGVDPSEELKTMGVFPMEQVPGGTHPSARSHSAYSAALARALTTEAPKKTSSIP